MADTDTTVAHDDHHDDHGHGEHEIHMPPNSWVPINVALSLTVFFIGFLTTRAVGPTLWIIGLLWFIASCVVWYKAARTEYGDTPD